MMNVQLLLRDVLKDITPPQSILVEAENFLKRINQELRRAKLPAKAVFGGSYAKNTWLAGDYDVDVFVKFKASRAHEPLSDLLEKAIKKWKPERIHGSRDYFHIKNGIQFEIVPVLDIKKPADAHNVTDFSPLHVSWVNNNGRKLKGDIRLAKKFLKAQKIYGAESYIKGFSGHVVDIITIHAGGFIKLLKKATKWKPKTIIDPNKVYRGGQAELVLNKSKIEGPLIVVDPLQPERNAAAAISREKYDLFVKSAKAFLKKPSKNFFIEKKFSSSDLKKQKNILILQVTALKGKEDTIGTKLLKAFEFFEEKFDEFNILDAGWNWDKKTTAFFWYKLKHNELPVKKILQGPPISMLDHVNKFKQVHKKTFEKQKRIFAIVAREECTVTKLFNLCKQNVYLKDKVNSLKVV